jgi:hypothetical protein
MAYLGDRSLAVLAILYTGADGNMEVDKRGARHNWGGAISRYLICSEMMTYWAYPLIMMMTPRVLPTMLWWWAFHLSIIGWSEASLFLLICSTLYLLSASRSRLGSSLWSQAALVHLEGIQLRLCGQACSVDRFRPSGPRMPLSHLNRCQWSALQSNLYHI